MVKTITVLVGLLLATSAGAQSRVYTNTDVGRPLSQNRPTVTVEQLAGLEARQFRGSPVQEWGPQVVILDSQATDGPFGAFAPFSPSHVAPGGVYFETVGPAYYGGYGYGIGSGYGYGLGRSFGTHERAYDRRPAMVPARVLTPGRSLPPRILPGLSRPLAPRPRRD